MTIQAIIVGAGIAGVAAAVLLQNKVPNLTYTVFEKNSRVVSAIYTLVLLVSELMVKLGRDLGRKYIPWSSVRCTIAFLPTDF